MRTPSVPQLPVGVPWGAIANAYAHALLARRRLPPGELVDIGERERAQRTLLIDLAREHGPVFKGLMEGRLVVCIVGDALGKRLLKEHAEDLRAVAIRVESLFPHGFMRRMEGDVHRHYRKALVRSLRTIDPGALDGVFEATAAAALAEHVADGDRRVAWSERLAHIAASTLVTLFFGPGEGTPSHERLLSAYRRLGPHGVAWHIGHRQVVAFRALRAEIEALGSQAGGVLGSLRNEGALDATMLGNLIYMVELGRYDLRGLLRWVSRYAADHPSWLDRIAAEACGAACAPGPSVAEAFVQETLRMDQSERLMRDVVRDVAFDGWLIPKGALVRVCMWESHKDPQAFPHPFTFDPGRFLSGASAAEQLHPFGLDHHHCPLAIPVTRIAVAFLRALARGYRLRGQGAEPAVRGPYHWEPSPRFDVRLEPRSREQAQP